MTRRTSGKTKNYFIMILLIVIIVAGLFIYARATISVAKVNGEKITRLRFVKELEKQAGKKVIEGMITKTLLYQEGARRNITVGDTEVQNEIKKIESNLKKQNTTLKKALAAQDLTREDLYQRIKLNLLGQKLVQQYTKVSDQEVENFIARNPNGFGLRPISQKTKDEIKENLRLQKITRQIQILINNLRAKAKVEVYIQ